MRPPVTETSSMCAEEVIEAFIKSAPFFLFLKNPILLTLRYITLHYTTLHTLHALKLLARPLQVRPHQRGAAGQRVTACARARLRVCRLCV